MAGKAGPCAWQSAAAPPAEPANAPSCSASPLLTLLARPEVGGAGMLAGLVASSITCVEEVAEHAWRFPLGSH
jgi:hypothetical protein